MKWMLTFGKTVLKGIYGIHKLAKRNSKKVVFLSRQESMPIDFRLLDAELKRLDAEIKTVFCCRTMKPGLGSKVLYLVNIIGPQLHALATSKVAVLDSYSAPISMLNHLKRGDRASRDGLKVIQIWHAMGALKKFSKSIVGQKEGRSEELAEALDMHRNYDMILTSSPESREAFQDAFGYPEESFLIGALPRTDLLKDKEYLEKKRVEILEDYPLLKGKKIVLYAPTLRIQDQSKEEEVRRAKELIQALDDEFYVLISPHPVKMDHYRTGSKIIKEGSEGVPDSHLIPDRSTFDLLALCDYFVTDYSAVVYEAAVAGKPIFLYAYDLDYYLDSRGFYLDYEKDMPNEPRRTAAEISDQIRAYDRGENASELNGKVKAFADRFVKSRDNNTNYNNTNYLAEKIIELMKM